MFNLSDINISYLIISPEKEFLSSNENHINCERICSILYSKDYTIIPIKSYLEGRYDKSFIAINSDDNDTMRMDAIYLMDCFDEKFIIAKYEKESNPSKINRDGSEIPMIINIYDSNLENKTYVFNGISFSFSEQRRYFFPKKKEDMRTGMIVEYFNNNRWIAKKISNIDMEYDRMYKLLIKYEKVRVPQYQI